MRDEGRGCSGEECKIAGECYSGKMGGKDKEALSETPQTLRYTVYPDPPRYGSVLVCVSRCINFPLEYVVGRNSWITIVILSRCLFGKLFIFIELWNDYHDTNRWLKMYIN